MKRVLQVAVGILLAGLIGWVSITLLAVRLASNGLKQQAEQHELQLLEEARRQAQAEKK